MTIWHFVKLYTIGRKWQTSDCVVFRWLLYVFIFDYFHFVHRKLDGAASWSGVERKTFRRRDGKCRKVCESFHPLKSTDASLHNSSFSLTYINGSEITFGCKEGMTSNVRRAWAFALHPYLAQARAKKNSAGEYFIDPTPHRPDCQRWDYR